MYPPISGTNIGTVPHTSGMGPQGQIPGAMPTPIATAQPMINPGQMPGAMGPPPRMGPPPQGGMGQPPGPVVSLGQLPTSTAGPGQGYVTPTSTGGFPPPSATPPLFGPPSGPMMPGQGYSQPPSGFSHPSGMVPTSSGPLNMPGSTVPPSGQYIGGFSQMPPSSTAGPGSQFPGSQLAGYPQQPGYGMQPSRTPGPQTQPQQPRRLDPEQMPSPVSQIRFLFFFLERFSIRSKSA